MRRLAKVPLVVPLLLALVACAPGQPPEPAARAAPSALPAMNVFGPTRPMPVRRSNAAIAQDFLDLAFEMESGRPVPVMTRHEGPVRVRLTGPAPATAAADLARLLARLRGEAGIDIAAAQPGEDAAITVEFLPRRKLQALVPQAACFVVPNVTSWDEFRRARRSALVDWTTLQRRERATVFVPSDTAPQEIRDCLHEEIAQALGPLNDLYRLPDSVFNDDNFHAVLTGFDMLVLRAYYAPELGSGMSRAEVAARLPGILARINPAGGAGGIAPAQPTPRAWTTAMQTALGPKSSRARRQSAARQAVSIAEASGWRDVRAGFGWFATGRLALGQDTEAALAAFLTAGEIYHALPDAALQSAYVDMQMAAYALSAGQAEGALGLVNGALAPVIQAENAALLGTLLMVKAEALDELGRASEARAVRLDSLGWARYGFGSDSEVRSRLNEIAALAPRNRTRTE